MKKILLISVIIFTLLLVALAAILFFRQKRPAAPAQAPTSQNLTPDPTANWTTFINKHGWSVKYPPDWKAVLLASPSANIATEAASMVDLTGPNNCSTRNSCGVITFDSLPWQTAEISKMTAKQYFFGYLLPATKSKFDLLTERPIELAKTPGHEIVFKHGGQLIKQLAIKHNGKIFTIGVTESINDPSIIKSTADWTMRSLYDQILETFKFND